MNRAEVKRSELDTVIRFAMEQTETTVGVEALEALAGALSALPDDVRAAVGQRALASLSLSLAGDGLTIPLSLLGRIRDGEL